MSCDAVNVLEAAMRLPEEERADLAARLLDSLDPQVDDDAPAAWDEEIARRVAELDAKSVVPIPWPQVRRKLISILHAKSHS